MQNWARKRAVRLVSCSPNSGPLLSKIAGDVSVLGEALASGGIGWCSCWLVQLLAGAAVRWCRYWLVQLLDGTGIGWCRYWLVQVLAGAGIF